MKVDWIRMSAEDIYESLRSAPNVAGAWTSENHYRSPHTRRAPNGDKLASIHEIPFTGIFNVYVPDWRGSKLTLAEAKTFADDLLCKAFDHRGGIMLV